MSLLHLRHSSLASLQRPLGRLAVLLLTVAVISSSLPIDTVHAHADGHVHHTHHHLWDIWGIGHSPESFVDCDDTQPLGDHCESSADHCEDTVPHVHDTSLTTALPTSPPSGLIVLPPAGLVVAATAGRLPEPPLSSLYRPPIV